MKQKLKDLFMIYVIGFPTPHLWRLNSWVRRVSGYNDWLWEHYENSITPIQKAKNEQNTGYRATAKQTTEADDAWNDYYDEVGSEG